MKLTTDKGEEIEVETEFMRYILRNRLDQVRDWLEYKPRCDDAQEQENKIEAILRKLES